jgi:membrane AbrB-like protein
MLVAVLAATLSVRFRAPGGPLVAALIAVGILHVLADGMLSLPREVRIVAQVVVGAAIGSNIRREPLLAIWRQMPKIVTVSAGVVAAAAAFGVALAVFTGFDLLTMLLATVPGGASDVSAAALEFGSDAAIVAAFQLIRQMTIFIVITTILRKVLDDGTAL